MSQGLTDTTTKTVDVTDKATRSVGRVRLRNPGDTVDLGDTTNALRIDPTGTTTQPVSDAAGSLTVDAPVGTPVAARLSDGAAFLTTTTGRLSVDASGVAVPVTDNAGSLTVDAPVGTPVAVRQSDGAAFYELPIRQAREAAFVAGVSALAELDDTATVVPAEGQAAPLRITAQRGLHANLRNVAGTELGTATTPVRTDPTGTTTQPVSDAAGTLTVDAPVGTPVAVRLSDGAAFIDPRDVSDRAARLVGQVEGRAASGVAVAGNPNLIGARANLNEPAVVADGQAVSLWADQLGRLVVLAGHPNPEPPVTVNGSAAGVTVIAAPGAGVSLYINRCLITNRAAAENVVSLRDGAAGSIRFTGNFAADGGGAVIDFGDRGWKLTANTALVADIGAASADVNVLEYSIAA